ncbi:MAG: UDP-N-acetylmuramoyl-L-alanine--D-glutamate ligase [Actinomycetota bacterium]|nr:UDP-N-acetylmuramoyl-L-alanine--D-glutamate ligase [Actinomycetota bacterium]
MTRPDLSRVVVGGLGITGRALTEALIFREHRVTVVDDRPKSVTALADALGIELVDSKSLTELEKVVSDATAVVASPGIPPHHPLQRIADEQGVPVLSELDVGALWDERPRAAVTGTNGKTTVTELTSRILERSGIKAAAVGNTSTPFVGAIADESNESQVFVVEASSFALHRSRYFQSHAAAWLNLSPDHLDWHGDFESYATAKSKIFQGQQPSDFAIIPHQRDTIAPWLGPVQSQTVTFGLSTGDIHCTEHELIAHGERVIDLADLRLSRPHDCLNACAAVALSLSMGASLQGGREVLSEFAGLAHRMEFVKSVKGVRFFNDSKATTPHATIAGVEGFNAVVLIAGGRNKGLDLTGLAAAKPLLRAVVAIGESSDTVAEIFAGALPVVVSGSMGDAVAQAFRLAEQTKADVVLSPACASFDWYGSYSERGDDFKQIVHRLDPRQVTK